MPKPSELSDFKRQRGTIRCRLTNFKKFLVELVENKELTKVLINECSLRLSKIEESFNLFDEVQSNIESLDSSSEQLKEREDTENEFYSLMAQAQACIAAFKDNQHQGDEFISLGSRHRGGVKNIKLPQLRIPSFDGKKDSWLEFRDLYLSLIHDNEDIDNICKFHYLKSYLEGDASLVIRSVPVSAESYPIAWSLLCERYDNKRLLINQHLKSLFGMEPLSRESAKGLRQLIDNLSKNLQVLKSLGEDTEGWDTLIISMASSKLDTSTARRWEEFRSDITSPSMQDFYKFLRNRADILETVGSPRLEINKNDKRQVVQKTKSFLTSTSEQSATSVANIASYQCVFCQQNHSITACPGFKALSVDERYHLVSQCRLCRNCLRADHSTFQCHGYKCRICKGKHNVLLHKQSPKQQPGGEEAASISNSNIQLPQMSTAPSPPIMVEPESKILSNTAVTMAATYCKQVLLSTALVEVSKNGNKYVLRALLDSGSQSSFITEVAKQRIGYDSINVSRSVSGINDSVLKINAYCNLNLKSLHTSFRGSARCYVCVTDKLPSTKVRELNIPSNITLADPKYYHPAEIDLLLGSDIFWDLIKSNQIKLGKNLPVLTETELGWVVAGPTGGRPMDSQESQNIRCDFSQDNKDQLRKLWELEELPNAKVKDTLEDDYCEKLFNVTIYRNSDDRYVCQVPFPESPDALGDSYKMVVSRLLSIQRKMTKNPTFKNGYTNFIKEYKDLRHLTEVLEVQVGSQFLSYMPHAVFREHWAVTERYTARRTCSTGRLDDFIKCDLGNINI